jgi:heat shock protein HtpX
MTLMVTVPFVGWMLRHRRYLADATAVQLTRYPEALASALHALDPLARTRTGGHWAPQFFIVDAADPRFETPLVLFGVHPPVRDRRERILHFRNRIGRSEV